MTEARRATAVRFLYRLPDVPPLARMVWRQGTLVFRLLARLRPHYIPAVKPRMTRGLAGS